jgi:hypothetical protein
MQAEGKHKALDQSSQARADPEVSIQVNTMHSIQSHLNHSRLRGQVLPLLLCWSCYPAGAGIIVFGSKVALLP